MVALDSESIIGGISSLGSGSFGTIYPQFVQNVGQAPPEVSFYTIHTFPIQIIRDGRIRLASAEISFGSSPRYIVGDMEGTARVSYFGMGMELSNIPTYRRVILKEVYENVDVILTTLEDAQVEMQFIVHPGGNPDDITLKISGAPIRDLNGHIYVGERFKITDAVSYQGANEIPLKVIVEGNTVRFKVGDYDRNFTLVIDPVVAAVVGGDMYDEAYAVALDSAGNVFVAGYTLNGLTFAPSRTFFGTPRGGAAFVTKLSNDLTTHIATAILTSAQDDWAVALAIDSVGNVFVGGATLDSYTFAPTRSIFGTPGDEDAFVTKLSNDLTVHFATAILTGSGWDNTISLSFDRDGNILAAGFLQNLDDFVPGTVVFGTPGMAEAFVARLSGDLSTVLSVAALCGDDYDVAVSVAEDSDGNVLVAGGTFNARNFAPSRTVLGPTGRLDAFITKLSADMSTHIATAIIGDVGNDYAYSFTLDSDGNVLVGGGTDFFYEYPGERYIFGAPGGFDVFVFKLSADLTTPMATAIIGSPGFDLGEDVVIAPDGSVLVTGITDDGEHFAPDRIISGVALAGDVFVSKLSPDLSTHLRTVIVGGRRFDYAYALAMDSYGNAFVGGSTENPDTLAEERHFFGARGGYEAFVLRIPAGLLAVEERPPYEEHTGVSVEGDRLVISTDRDGYVGWNVYSSDGRLLQRESIGFLPAGRYSYRLNLKRGKYLLIVRVGDQLKKVKVVR